MILNSLTLPCGAVIENRLAKAAMTERLAHADHNPNELHYHLYETWAKSAPGLIITGNIMVDRKYLESGGNIVVEDNRAMIQLRKWASAARQNGSHFWGQINCAGRQSTRFLTQRPIAPSTIGVRGKLGFFAKPRPMTEDEILEYIERYAATARILKEAGFTGVQIHAAHGYLLSQFLSPRANKRNDQFGGSLENRARFLIEVYKAVRSETGDDFPISVKINSSDHSKGGFAETDSMQVIQELDKLGVDLIEISGGSYDHLAFLKGTSETKQQGPFFAEFAKAASEKVSTPIMLTGGIHGNKLANKLLENKFADMVGVARPFLLDPFFGKKFLSESEFSLAPKPLPSAPDMLAWMVDAGVYSKHLVNMAEQKKVQKKVSTTEAIGHIVMHELGKAVSHHLLG